MRALIALLALLLLGTPPARAQFGEAAMVQGPSAPLGYQGPGNQVSGASVFYGLRAYSNAYAVALGNAIQVRRASDNTTQNIAVLSTGPVDIAAANTFAGPDGGTGVCTASTSGSSTTLTISVCTASATLHAGDTLTCASCVQPVVIRSLGTFTGTGAGAAGTVTLNVAQNITSQSVTSQIALFIRTFYDQSGHSIDQLQATNGLQAQLLPNCVNALPCAEFVAASTQNYAGTLGGTVAQPWSLSSVVRRTGNFANFTNYLAGSGAAPDAGGWTDSVNTAYVSSHATLNVTATASDAAAHSIQGVLSGTSSFIVIDGVASGTQNGGTDAFPTAICIGALCSGAGLTYLTAYFMQTGLWPNTLTPTQYGNLHSNDSAYWGSP